MKLLFLGAGRGGIPAPDCHSCAALLECGGGYYLIDAGAPVIELMIQQGLPAEKLRGVFITHMHGDHTFGLPALCSIASWHYTNCRFDVFLSEERGAAALKEMILAMDKSFCEERIRLCTAAPGVIYTDDSVTVTAIPTAHCQPYPSFAYMVEGEGKRVFFSGDLHRPDGCDFPSLFRELPSDLIVCEMAHITHEIMIPMLGGCPAKKVVFNHISWDYDTKMAAIRDTQGKYPMPILPARDGDSIEI